MDTTKKSISILADVPWSPSLLSVCLHVSLALKTLYIFAGLEDLASNKIVTIACGCWWYFFMVD